MANLSTSPIGDKRQRAGRTAPRRHVERVETSETAVYDGDEFPVLLRLPDILREHMETDPQEERVLPVVEGSDSSSDRSGASVKERRQRNEVRADDEPLSLFTALAAHRFWSSLAPRVAAGGMLLAVTAVCVVMLQGSRESDGSTNDNTSQWVNDGPLQSYSSSVSQRADERRSDAATSGESAWPSKPNSLAVKPASPQLATPPGRRELYSEAKTTNSPGMIGEPAFNGNLPTGWSSNSGAVAPAASGSLLQASPSFQAQGWPSDMGQGPESTAPGSEGTSNSPTMPRRPVLPEMPLSPPTTFNSSAMSEITPAGSVVPVGGSLVPSRNVPPPPGNPPWISSPTSTFSGSARLNGTVEVPNPRAEFRR